MDGKPESVAQQVEEFHQRLAEAAYFQRQFLRILVWDQLRQNLAAVRTTPRPHQSVLRRLRQRLLTRRQPKVAAATPTNHH